MNPLEFKRIRLKLGYKKVSEFAEYLELSNPTIYKYENGESEIKRPVEMLMRFLDRSYKNKRIEISESSISPSEFKKIRKKLGCETPAEFAHALDVTHKTIYNYENGDIRIKHHMSMLMQYLDAATKKKLREIGL